MTAPTLSPQACRDLIAAHYPQQPEAVSWPGLQRLVARAWRAGYETAEGSESDQQIAFGLIASQQAIINRLIAERNRLENELASASARAGVAS